MRIGEVARKSQVDVETIRFYEREGLITLPRRSVSSYRQYSESIIRQIQFIKQAKTLGFSLREIGELIELKNTQNKCCTSIKSTAGLPIVARLLRPMNKVLEMPALLGALFGLGALVNYEVVFFYGAHVLIVIALIGHIIAYKKLQNRGLLALAIFSATLFFIALYIIVSENLSYLALTGLVIATIWMMFESRRRLSCIASVG